MKKTPTKQNNPRVKHRGKIFRDKLLINKQLKGEQ